MKVQLFIVAVPEETKHKKLHENKLFKLKIRSVRWPPHTHLIKKVIKTKKFCFKLKQTDSFDLLKIIILYQPCC